MAPTSLDTLEALERYIRDTIYAAANDSAGYGDPGVIAAVILKDQDPILFGFRKDAAHGVKPVAQARAREHSAVGVIFSRVVETGHRKEVVITLEHRSHGLKEWRADVKRAELAELRGPFEVAPKSSPRLLAASYLN